MPTIREDERGGGRADDEEGVLDPPAGVEERVGDEREPEHDQEQDQQVDDQVQRVVGDAEEGEGHGREV